MIRTGALQANSPRDSLKKYLFLLGPLVILFIYAYLSSLRIKDGFIFWIVDISIFWIIPITSLYVLYKLYKVTPEQYGLFKKLDRYLYSGKDIIVDSAIAAFGFFIVGNAIYWVVCAFPPSGCSEGYFSEYEKYGLVSYFLIKLYISATAAIIEEIYYRGILYKIFSDFISNDKAKKVIYVTISSFLFMLVHVDHQIAGLIAVFFVGVFACSFYLHSKRLEPLIFGHFILDITA